MFDIGFFELIIIAMVGLFVIGPERLPETIKTVALWVGRIKRNLLETRTEIEQQLGADEIRRQLQNEQVLHNLEKMKDTRRELEEKIRQWKTGEALEQLVDDSSPKIDAEVSSAGTTEGGEAPTTADNDGQPTAGHDTPAAESPSANSDQPHSDDADPKKSGL